MIVKLVADDLGNVPESHAETWQYVNGQLEWRAEVEIDKFEEFVKLMEDMGNPRVMWHKGALRFYRYMPDE